MKKTPWTEEEIELLKKGVTPPKRSFFSIKNMRQRLGLVAFKAFRWNKEQEEKLIQLLNEGKTQKEISLILSFSQKSIQKKISRLNLQKTRQYKFTNKQLNKFKKFLVENWKNKTPIELTDLWNKNNVRKIGKNKVLYHLKKMSIKIDKKESIRLSFLNKKQKEIQNKFDNLKESEIKIRELRMKLMRKRIEENKDIWTGLPLSEAQLENSL